MAAAPCFTGLTVESIEFPATVKLPNSTVSYFLGGAGERGLTIDGKFIKFTVLGVYLEDKAVPSLAQKWKNVSADELQRSLDFYRDIISGPYVKFTRGTKLLPLSGKEYAEKVSANCVKHLKSVGAYGNEEAIAVESFIGAFKDKQFPPGSSVFYEHSPAGTLTVGVSKEGALPEEEIAVIHNKPLSEAVLETMIGEHGVSPALKKSLAVRISDILQTQS